MTGRVARAPQHVCAPAPPRGCFVQRMPASSTSASAPADPLCTAGLASLALDRNRFVRMPPALATATRLRHMNLEGWYGVRWMDPYTGPTPEPAVFAQQVCNGMQLGGVNLHDALRVGSVVRVCPCCVSHTCTAVAQGELPRCCATPALCHRCTRWSSECVLSWQTLDPELQKRTRLPAAKGLPHCPVFLKPATPNNNMQLKNSTVTWCRQ